MGRPRKAVTAVPIEPVTTKEHLKLDLYRHGSTVFGTVLYVSKALKNNIDDTDVDVVSVGGWRAPV
jgi:hypothetical protein